MEDGEATLTLREEAKSYVCQGLNKGADLETPLNRVRRVQRLQLRPSGHVAEIRSCA